MKKSVGILTAFALCLSLCSCGESGGGTVIKPILLILLTLFLLFLAFAQTNTAVKYMRRPRFSSRAKKRKGPIVFALVLYLLAVTSLICTFFTAGALKDIPASSAGVESGISGTVSEESSEPSDEPSSSESEADYIEQDWMSLPRDYEITAKKYFAYSLNREDFLLKSDESDTKVYPASVTKLFTAYVALEHLALRHIVTVDDALDLVAWDASVAGLKKGDKLTVDMLIEAMLLPSGNDAAYVLAVEIGRILEQDTTLTAAEAAAVFVDEMNRQARLVGMESSHFMNPDGMHDDNHYLSIADLTLLAELALENETISKYAATVSEQVTFYSGKNKTWENTNALINPESEYYCPLAIGLKTGQTSAAGSCLLSAFRFKDDIIIVGVFDAHSYKDRFTDSLYILNTLVRYQQYI